MRIAVLEDNPTDSLLIAASLGRHISRRLRHAVEVAHAAAEGDLTVKVHAHGDDEVAEVLAARDRDMAGATAKAGGLYLVDVTYPDHFGLPQTPLGPLWLPDCEPGMTSFQ